MEIKVKLSKETDLNDSEQHLQEWREMVKVKWSKETDMKDSQQHQQEWR